MTVGNFHNRKEATARAKNLNDEEVFLAPITQYLRPNGTRRQITIELQQVPFERLVNELHTANCCLEVEVLTTGEVSGTVSYIEAQVDIDIFVCRNGREVPLCFQEMLLRRSWEKKEENSIKFFP